MNPEELEALIRRHAPRWVASGSAGGRSWAGDGVAWSCTCGVSLEANAADWPTHLAHVLVDEAS